MRLLTNPVFLMMAGGLAVFVIAIIAGAFSMRYLRRQITEEGEVGPGSASAERSAEFQAAAYQGVIRRLKEQERELQGLRDAERDRAARSENISEAVLSNLSSGVLLFDRAGLVRQANPAARAILGYGSMFGLQAADVFRGVSALRGDGADTPPSSLPEAIGAALTRGASFRRLEADYQAPSGEQRVLGVTLSPVKANSGESLGATCLVSDLTEISNLARQVRLKEYLVSLGEMSAGIAHEFKNSLATISGYAQMLTADNDSATVRDFASRITTETGSLTRIVTDFLRFARPQELHPEPVEVRGLLQDCARECGLTLSFGDFPDDCRIEGDPTALRQAFSNLLRNSAEAARDGSGVRVQASAETSGAGTRITLKDDGKGIPADILPRVFIPFFTTTAQGTGLGLALVQRIVSEHGGTIAVASDTSGTTFTLSFPAQMGAKKPGIGG